ncbi:MAG: DUF86 domain-containing protein [Bacteroidales bacterium]|nr:DUF86 domain-containing protein [Bacteroidales bacterium]
MDRKLRKYLFDIQNSIAEIESFMEGHQKKYAEFQNDTLLRRGIERNMEIMGEAMNQVLKLNPEIQITSARKVVDTRNYIIHSYDTIMPEILWGIIVNHLPLLKIEVNTLLEDSFSAC